MVQENTTNPQNNKIQQENTTNPQNTAGKHYKPTEQQNTAKLHKSHTYLFVSIQKYTQHRSSWSRTARGQTIENMNQDLGVHLPWCAIKRTSLSYGLKLLAGNVAKLLNNESSKSADLCPEKIDRTMTELISQPKGDYVRWSN